MSGDWTLPKRGRRGRVVVAIDDHAHLSTVDVVNLTGLSYRQLDHLARRLQWTPGYGTRRRWSRSQVTRLRIAAALNEASGNSGGPGTSNLPLFARVVMDGPEPPESGWAAYTHGTVVYGASPAVALKGTDSGLVTRIPT